MHKKSTEAEIFEKHFDALVSVLFGIEGRLDEKDG